MIVILRGPRHPRAPVTGVEMDLSGGMLASHVECSIVNAAC
jgi:hypothetical protein